MRNVQEIAMLLLWDHAFQKAASVIGCKVLENNIPITQFKAPT